VGIYSPTNEKEPQRLLLSASEELEEEKTTTKRYKKTRCPS